MTLPLVAVAAVARNGAIGRDNALPWRLPGDLRHFRALTMGKPVIMGRKTWQSIGKPLPGRFLVVVSSDAGLALPDGVTRAENPEAGVAAARRIAAEREADAVVLAGGATLYGALMARTDRLEITEVDLAPEADSVFPPIDPAVWLETSRDPQPRGPGDDADFAFVTYARRDGSRAA